jgi:hypothetical protein
MTPVRILSISLLRLRDFRALTVAVLLNSIGMMGENVVLGWLTLELTNSPFLVGVAMGTRMLPPFFVGVTAGVPSTLPVGVVRANGSRRAATLTTARCSAGAPIESPAGQSPGFTVHSWTTTATSPGSSTPLAPIASR